MLTRGVFPGGLFNQPEFMSAIEFLIVLMALASAAAKVIPWVLAYRDAKIDYEEFVEAKLDGADFKSDVNRERARAKADVASRRISVFKKKEDYEKEKLIASKLIDDEKKKEERDIVTARPRRDKEKGGEKKKRNKKKGAAA